MYFVPLRHQKTLDIIDSVIKAAQDQAKIVGEAQKLKMRVEPLRPVHLNLANYKMEYNAGNEKAYTMQQNCGLFIAGITQYDASLNDVKIRKGSSSSANGSQDLSTNIRSRLQHTAENWICTVSGQVSPLE